MDMTEKVLTAVLDYQKQHGKTPARGYVSIDAADRACKAQGGVIFDAKVPWKWSEGVLMVTDWFVDPNLRGDDFRLEG